MLLNENAALDEVLEYSENEDYKGYFASQDKPNIENSVLFNFYNTNKLNKYLDSNSQNILINKNLFEKFTKWIDNQEYRIASQFKRRNNELTKKLFDLIIANLLNASFNLKTLAIPKSRNVFVTSAEFSKKINLSLSDARINFYYLWIAIFSFLKYEGLIDEHLGIYSSNPKYSRSTRVWLTAKGNQVLINPLAFKIYLKEIFHEEKLMSFTEKIDKNNSQKLNLSFYYKNREYEKKKKEMKKIYDSFEDIEQSIRINELIVSENIINHLFDLIFSQSVHVIDFQISIPKVAYDLIIDKYKALSLITDLQITFNEDKLLIKKIRLDVIKSSPTRIFCHCEKNKPKTFFQKGGRLYGQTFTNLKSDLRKYFYLENKSLFGCFDFSSQHLRMLFYLNFTNPPIEDVYKFDLMTEFAEYGEELQRLFVKKSTLCCINSKNYNIAICGFIQTVRDEIAGLSGMTNRKISSCFSRIINNKRFDPIRKKYFFKGIGAELQKLDSDIIVKSLIDLFNLNIHCISLHDAIYFTTQDKQEISIIEQVMSDNYNQIMSEAVKKGISSELSIDHLKFSPDLKLKFV